MTQHYDPTDEAAEMLLPGVPTPRSALDARREPLPDPDSAAVDVDELRAALAAKSWTPVRLQAESDVSSAGSSESTSSGLHPLLTSDDERARRHLEAVSGRRAEVRRRREAMRRRKRRRRRQTLIAAIVFVLLAGGITAGVLIWRKNATTVPDYAGAAGPQTIIHVQSGDTTNDIAQTLVDDKVVESTKAFLDVAVNDPDINHVQPGYYRVQTHLSGATAVDQMVDVSSRVGQLDIIPGGSLADTTVTAGGKTTVHSGYITQITKAACVPLDRVSKCWTADDLWNVAKTADVAQLGVPVWAVDDAQAAPDPSRRLEGLIYPGAYDVPPNESPLDTLTDIMKSSTSDWTTSNLVGTAKSAGLTPYQAVTIGSLVEREATTEVMPKVAAVIENRIQIQQKLQLDSTVLYVFHLGSVSTTGAQRGNTSPWNTYMHAGLPPTPISSPGPDALTAATDPASGSWLYFVEINAKTQEFCFSQTDAEHEKCVEQARKNGVFDG